MKPNAQPAAPHPAMLSLTEAASFLRCHPNTVRAWVRQGKLAAVPMGEEKVTMFLKTDVERLRKPLEEAGVIVKEDKHAFPVVGIGASAGGLDAMSRLLQHLPTDLGLAYVFVTHQEKDQEKTLSDLLRKRTTMPVFVIENGMRLEPDRLYVNPAGMYTAVVSGTFTMQVPRGRVDAGARPIDAFFTALAGEYQNNAIGIVLSGGGVDGTEGLRAIKAEDGLTIAQDDSAQDPGMPRNARESDVVDLVRKPEEIGRELAELVKQLFPGGKARIPSKHENELRRILQYVLEQRGVDFSEYKETTIHRRIIRRMVLSKCRKLSEYSALLRGIPSELDTLYNDLLINVTSFFRDPAFHKALSERVLPELLHERAATDALRIWVPACAGGEEVVSIAITLLEFLGERAISTPVQIFSTDLNERTIEKARLGIYKKSALQDMPPERVAKYFMHVDGHYQVIKPIRDMCVFAKHDLLKDPPFSRVDLISCQNVLIYLENAAQGRILKSFHYALKPSGFLALGKSETPANAGDIFVQPDREHKVYRKKRRGGGERLNLDLHFKPMQPTAPLTGGPTPSARLLGPRADMEREMEQVLLHRYVPASVLVNKDLEIVRFLGSTAPFLGPSTGKASLSLLKMVRDDLAFELRALLQKARKERIPMRKSGIPIRLNNGLRDVGLEILPMGDTRDQHFLVLFREEGFPAPELMPTNKSSAAKRAVDARDKRIAALEQELQDAREQVRLISEESEVTMHELQASNEEVVSSNEELQSINEELETSKEELQSINEEFATINEELQARNDALLESEERYRKLIDLMPVAVYTCDTSGHVRLFNEAAVRLWGRTPVEGETLWCGSASMRNTDGTDLPLDQCPMAVAIREQRSMTDIEAVVVRPGGEQRAVLANPTPLYDAQGRISGAINVLVDITDRTENQRRLDLATKVGKLGIWDWDIAGDSIEWTDAVYSIHGVEKGSFVPNMSGYNELIHPDDRERVGTAIKATLEENVPYEIEFRTLNKKGEVNWVYTNAVVLRDGGRPVRMLGGTMNITERKKAERELIQSEERFKAVFDHAAFGIMLSSTPDARIVDANPAALAMMGLSREELIGKTSLEAGINVDPETRQRQIEELQRTGHLGEAEVQLRHTSGSIVTARVTGNMVTLGGTPYNLVVLEDITERKAARAVQRHLAAIVESSDDAIISKDLNGVLLTWNKGAERMLGYKAEEIIGRPNALLFPEDRLEEETLLFERLKQGERIEHYETVRVHKDGTHVHVAVTLSPLKNERGEIIGASKTIRDISQEKRAREVLRESEERFHLLADNVKQLIWMAEADGSSMWFNQRWYEFTGLTGEQIRMDAKSLHHPDHYDRVTNSLRERAAKSQPWEETFPLKGKDGEYRWFLATAMPVLNTEGKVVRWFGTCTDITTAREAQALIQENEERFRMLADNMSQMAYVADANGRITWVNRRWTEYTGMGVEEMNDGGWSKAVDPAHFDDMVASYSTAQQKGEPWEYIFRVQSTKGEYRWFLSRSVPIHGDDGKVERWFGTNTDITEQKLAEAALEESAVHKDHFLATLAHELRNPLAPLKNGLQLMQLSADDPGTLETTRSMMERQLDHMVRLVDDLMDLSRISRGKIELLKEPVDLTGIVATAIETSRPLIERSSHQLEVRFGPEAMVVNGDAARLMQVVANLLNNAAKYTPPGGRIHLSAVREKDEAVIRVKDNGVGIDPSAMPHVFDMFAQVDPTLKSEVGGGLGIGLNVVQRLVQMHNGTVEGQSEGLGKGSEFTVRIPLLPIEQPATGKEGTTVQKEETKRRVLVVDDNQDAALSMSLILKRRGHDVQVAHDGEHALKAGEAFVPEVVLMDIGMPRMNGYEACKHMRNTAWGKDIRIVALSGWGQEDDRKKSRAAGFDDHVVKPIDGSTLARVITESA